METARNVGVIILNRTVRLEPKAKIKQIGRLASTSWNAERSNATRRSFSPALV